jgi:phage baseplate assembly protein W
VPLEKTWSDLNLDFVAHPNTGELSLKKNEKAVVRSIRQLILTNFYERLFHPEIGCNVYQQLFEPMSAIVAGNIKDNIVETISNFEPRVELINVNVVGVESRNSYVVSLKFVILNEEIEVETQFFLERTR